MPYNSETSAYERRAATVIDATPDGDTVAVAIDVKLDQGIDDYVTDLNHHMGAGYHYPAPSVGSDSRFLKQTPAGVVSWADGVVAANAALKDMSNVPNGAISSAQLASVAPAKVTQDASNRFVTDTEKTTWNGALYDKADVESVLTEEITSHTHPSASESAAGLVELATTAEAEGGEDTSRAVTAAGVDAYHTANNIVIEAAYTAVGTETAIIFGSIAEPLPPNIKRLSVTGRNIGASGTSPFIIQLGTDEVFSVSGYEAQSGNGPNSSVYFTTGFPLAAIAQAAQTINYYGDMAFLNGECLYRGLASWSANSNVNYSAGGKTFSSGFNCLKLTTVNGTDVFDSGCKISISLEF